MGNALDARSWDNVSRTCQRIGDTSQKLSGILPSPFPPIDPMVQSASDDLAKAQQECQTWGRLR